MERASANVQTSDLKMVLRQCTDEEFLGKQTNITGLLHASHKETNGASATQAHSHILCVPAVPTSMRSVVVQTKCGFSERNSRCRSAGHLRLSMSKKHGENSAGVSWSLMAVGLAAVFSLLADR